MIDNENSPMPKYHMLKMHIKELIDQGTIQNGEQLPSENELARSFSISRHTVRQALSDLENEGWIYREQGKGTFCSPRIETKDKKAVAVLTTYISDYIFPHIITGIEEVLSNEGYSLILANSGNDKEKEAKCMENLISQGISGMIIEPAASAAENINLKLYRELDNHNIKYIMVHAAYADLNPAYIIMDDEKGEYEASKYLLQLGHRNIAGIFKSDDLQGVNREKGYVKALSEFGIPINKEYIGRYDTRQMQSYPYQFTKELLKRTDRPTAIACYNDQIALSVIEAIRDEGLKIPDDISIVGYDDSNLATASEIKLTTIKHPKKNMGRQAAQLLIDMLKCHVDKPSLVYQPELIVRSSCRNI